MSLRNAVLDKSRKTMSKLTLTMEPGGSMPHSQGLSKNPYPEPNQPNSYFLKIHSNIVLPSTPRPS